MTDSKIDLASLPKRPKRWFTTHRLKVTVQTSVFLLWISLIFATKHPIQGWLSDHIPVSLFLRADPLVTTVVWGGMRMGVTLLLLGVVTFLVTLILGRVFCGWVCPLGATFDFYSWILKFLKVPHFGPSPKFFRMKFYLLAALLFLACFGVASPLIGLDPVVLLTRTVASVFQPLFRQHGELGTGHVVDFASLILFALIMGYTTRVSRVWCRTACPLGAYLAVGSKVALLRRETKDCIQCGICSANCPTGAISFQDANIYNESECVKCFVCSDACPVDANFFTFKSPVKDPKTDHVQLDRRVFLGTLTTAALSIPILKADGGTANSAKTLIRPPMSREEPDFLNSCIRCGECMKACPTGTLKPSGFENGLRALWTPVMTPLEAPCKEGCNACSQACPTDAILKYPIENKYLYKSGTALFDTSKCIGYTEDRVCVECVRVCPTDAISFSLGWEPNPDGPRHKWGVPIAGNEKTAPAGQIPTRPLAVSFDACVGCGACEAACNEVVGGDPAMKTTSLGRATPTTLKKV